MSYGQLMTTMIQFEAWFGEIFHCIRNTGQYAMCYYTNEGMFFFLVSFYLYNDIWRMCPYSGHTEKFILSLAKFLGMTLISRCFKSTHVMKHVIICIYLYIRFVKFNFVFY